MIILASGSKSRAEILKENNISFKQIKLNFNEDMNKNLKPNIYIQKIIENKKNQFLQIYPNLNNLLFADSCVICNDKILNKPKDYNDAKNMLKMQSNNTASVISGFLFLGKKSIFSISSTIFKFKKFDEEKLEEYLQSKKAFDKAGAMMIEGFHKNFIEKQQGETSNAMGLNVKILKEFL